MFLICSAVGHREEVSAPWDQLQQQHHGQLVCQQFSAPCVLGLLWAGAQTKYSYVLNIQTAPSLF